MMTQTLAALALAALPLATLAQTAPAAPWLDQSQYPFQAHYLTTPAGRLHYVDEGQGEAVVFVHGTPSWSFLWRQPIRALSGQYRCIAPDHLGYGLSDKPAGWDYHPESHAANLERLLDSLQLREVTLVVHDFGGPIGLAFALRHPERVKRLVLLNTWLWPTAELPQARQADKLLHSWLGQFLYLSLNFSPKVLLKKSFAEPGKLPAAVHRQYLRPFPDRASRWGVLKTGRWLVRASDWYGSQQQQLGRLAGKPTLLLWGTKDPFFKVEDLARWQQLLPLSQAVPLESGHFVPEEQPERVVQELRRFLQEGSSSAQPR